VLNGSGVVIHTNLGRAPLPEPAIAAVAAAARGYANVELDLASGRRGTRDEHVRGLLCELTGAEDGIAVNNGAGAALLAVAAIGGGEGVAVSRGQLVEIGGGFRVPEVLAQAGVQLIEVGTTNRTHPADYELAIRERGVSAILRVHQSNFRMVGFTSQPDLGELADKMSGSTDCIWMLPPSMSGSWVRHMWRTSRIWPCARRSPIARSAT